MSSLLIEGAWTLETSTLEPALERSIPFRADDILTREAMASETWHASRLSTRPCRSRPIEPPMRTCYWCGVLLSGMTGRNAQLAPYNV